MTENRALEIVSGDYVFGLAADDKILPGFFETSMNLLAQYPQAGICSSRVLLIDEQGKEMGEQEIVAPIETAGFLPPKKEIALKAISSAASCLAEIENYLSKRGVKL